MSLDETTLTGIGVAFIASLVFTGLAIPYARWRQLYDVPGDRHSHDVPTPRGGGIGLVLGIVCGLAVMDSPVHWEPWCATIIIAVLVMCLLGWWDDHRSPGIVPRLLIQLLTCTGLLMLAIQQGWAPPSWAWLPALLWLLWMTNLYNFMDGSNGMAGLQAAFTGGVLSYLFYTAGNVQASAFSLVLTGASLGFLPWNLGRARIFMGDSGSLALGLLIAALCLYGVGSNSFSIPVAVLPMLLFLIDASLTLLVRVLKREQWYNPHKQHVYQRMIAARWSHGSVAATYQAINVLVLLPATLYALNRPEAAWIVLGLSVIVLSLAWFGLNKKFGVLA